MYKIELFFQSENGIYTKEEETASDHYFMNYKYSRMLDRWFKILCPHIDFDDYFNDLNGKHLSKYSKTINEKKYEIALDIIQRELEYQNKLFNENKKFTIKIIDLDNKYRDHTQELLDKMTEDNKQYNIELVWEDENE